MGWGIKSRTREPIGARRCLALRTASGLRAGCPGVARGATWRVRARERRNRPPRGGRFRRCRGADRQPLDLPTSRRLNLRGLLGVLLGPAALLDLDALADVLALASVSELGAPATEQHVVGAAAEQVVVAGPATEGVLAGSALDRVIARSSADVVCALATLDGVVAIAAAQVILSVRSGEVLDVDHDVVAVGTGAESDGQVGLDPGVAWLHRHIRVAGRVEAGAAVQAVVARTTEQVVVGCQPTEFVVAISAVQVVVGAAAGDRVALRATDGVFEPPGSVDLRRGAGGG